MRGNVRPGEIVVVPGIGGGVALFVLLFARSLGARVFVTSGSDEKIRRALELGAEGGVNYRDAEWVKKLTALCDGIGPDLVVDGNAGETLDRSLDLLRPGGRLVLYGATAGPVKELVARRIFWKHLTVLGSTMGSDRDFAQMVDLVASRKLVPVVDSVVPLHRVPEAHRRMEEGRQFGKIVLKIR